MLGKLPRPILSTTAFLAVGLAINLVIATAYRIGVDSQSHESELEALYEAHDEPIRVLSLGASYSLGGFDTRLTDDAYTYASSGEGYATTFVRLKQALKDHPEVEHVILPTAPQYFQERDYSYATLWMGWGDTFRYARSGGDWWDYLKDQLRRSLFPYAGKHQQVWNQMNGVGDLGLRRRPPLRGFQPSFYRRDSTFLAASAEDVVSTHYMGPADPQQVYFLEQIARVCAERGVALTLVEWPVTRHYARLAEGRFDPSVKEAAIAAARQHLPITYVNLRDFFAGRDEEVFGNADHINALGAFEATKVILERAGLPINEDVTAPLAPPDYLRQPDSGEIIDVQ